MIVAVQRSSGTKQREYDQMRLVDVDLGTSKK